MYKLHVYIINYNNTHRVECGGEGWGDGAAVDSAQRVEVDDSNSPTSPTSIEKAED